MLVKKGTATVIGTSGSGANTKTLSIDVLAVDNNGSKYAFAWNATNDQYQVNPPYAASFYEDVDPSTEVGATALFGKFIDVSSYSWATALTEVYNSEDSGGVSILDVYPRGSVYTTADTTFDPNTAWGGTWTGTAVSGKKQWIRTA